MDVTYLLGYVDSDWNVSGDITIENTGTLAAEITGIADVLGGTAISTSCSTLTFPYTLLVGETLTCTYDEDGYVEGKNEVTVMTQEDSYFADADIVWGEPTSEVNATVTIVDDSDLFGEVPLGTATAPNNAKFTYSEDFAWEDYGPDACGDYNYENTSSVIGDEDVVLDYATAEVDVYVQCYIYETAYAKADNGICFIREGFSQWGWTNPIGPDFSGAWDLWAGAGQCDTNKGTLVGSVTVDYTDKCVVVSYNVEEPYSLDETHVYAGCDMFPKMKVGKKWVDTVAPGQYYETCPLECEGDVYVIAHAKVGIPDPDFGL